MATMAHRVSAADDADFYPTPPWAARALCNELSRWFDLRAMKCWEPACGRGDMVMALEPYFAKVFASDIHPQHRPDYPYTPETADFLAPETKPPFSPDSGWVITNPPFSLSEEFFHRASALDFRRVALLLPLRWLESGRRYLSIFGRYPPALVLAFCERVPMLQGRLLRTASTAAAYCWVIWAPEIQAEDTKLGWIPPGSRRQFEQPGDYDDDHPDMFKKLEGEG